MSGEFHRAWRRSLLFLSVVSFGLTTTAQVWTGGVSTTWSNASNWSGGVPGGAATATFNSNTARDPNLTAAATAGRLFFDVGADAEIFTGSALTLNGIADSGILNQSGLTQTFSNTVVVGGAQTWDADNGDLSFAAVTLNNTLTLTGASAFLFNGTLTNSGGNRTLTNNATGSVTFSGAVSLSNNNTGRTLTFGGTGDTLVSGAIGNGGTGAGNIIKTGSGTLTLSGANTYTGTTTVGSSGGASGGTLRTGASNNLSNNTFTVFAGTLDLNGFNDTIGALNLGGGAAGTSATVSTGAGTLTLGGNVTYTATNNPDGATISGNLNLGSANRTFTVNNSTAADPDLTVSATITGANRNLTVNGAGNTLISGDIATGSGTLTKQAAGTLTLSGANSYTGLTTVSGGVLNIQHSSALGTTASGTTVASGAALQLEGGIAVGAEALTLSGTGIGGTGALLNAAGANSLAGNITLNANTTIGSAAGTLNLAGGISGNTRTLTVTGDGDTTIGGAITTTTGGLIKNGAGTLTLAGSNTYTGATTVNTGTLLLGASDAISNSSALTVASGATFDLNGFSDAVASLAGAGTVLLEGSGSLTTVGNASTTFSGVLSGDGTFTKQGTGILTLDNTTDFDFDGTFNLAGGTLRLSDLALTLGTLNITADSIIDFAGVSALNVTNFSISGGVTLTVQNWTDASDYFFTQFWTGASFDATGVNPMNQVTFTGFDANDTKWLSYEDNPGTGFHQITPVPEPSTYGALLLTATGGLLAWRRRRLSRQRN
ncbi:PEP-CTERM sorting domain-containing protein [Oleiharenicola lentus]|uniref:PEP-CTERM sorting domain-containing protein n=1 Tax=Oleiharenicola lentus TaxID=2508720 RepID=A0A4Q1C954_9BACT|nr:autotransporter-associated beta strand repeat-containing protein [Oleiharenicola lentus]RXK55527.1 PEP-CTERM sorting domain-containing protein [Oleiharenicola lentus]